MNFDDLVSILDRLGFNFYDYFSHFDEGVVKIKSKYSFELDRQKYGRDIGPKDGTFVFPKKLAKYVIEYSQNDPRKLESLLSLECGVLGDMPVLIDVLTDYIVRLPSGREKGANRHWKPGGLTQGGIPEAVVDSIKDGDYLVYPIF